MMTSLIESINVLLISFALLVSQYSCKAQLLPEDFGNVLTYGFQPFNLNSSLGRKVTEFTVNQVRKKLDWCAPPLQIDANIQECQRKTLIYSTDNKLPLFYDEVVKDRNSREYGITSLFTIGSVFHIGLVWHHKTLQYIHNLTVTQYPIDHFHVYSHTCLVKNINSTAMKIDKHDHRNIHFGESYFKHFTKASLDGDNGYSSKTVDVNQRLEKTGNQGWMEDDHADDSWAYTEQGVLKDNSGAQFHQKRSPWGQQRFSVMTYNIWNVNPVSGASGPYARRMKRLKQVILDSHVDILAVQEVRYEQQRGEELGPCQIHTLSSWLPQYQYVYQPAQMQPNTPYDGKTEEGVAILSRYPILAHHTHKLFINRSNSADTHQRILLHAEIFIPHVGKVHVFTTHLSLSHEAREESVRQIHDVLASVQGPAIVLGDFNAEPHERAMRYVTGGRMDASTRLGDLWLHVHNHTDKGHTFNALERKLTKRIDYILFRDSTTCCKVDKCSVLDDGLRGSKAASDHLPVKAEFSIHHQSTHKQTDLSRF